MTSIVEARDQLDLPQAVVLALCLDVGLASGGWSPDGDRVVRADDLPGFADGVRVGVDRLPFCKVEHESVGLLDDEFAFAHRERWLDGGLKCHQDMIPVHVGGLDQLNLGYEAHDTPLCGNGQNVQGFSL